MKKLINDAANYVDEVIEGMALMHPETYTVDSETSRVIRRTTAAEDKVSVVFESSFGTLMTTFLMASGKLVKGKEEVPGTDIPTLLQAALDSMISRGGASIGDKTVLDSVSAIVDAIANTHTIETATAAASQAADEALIEFKDKTCKIGRTRIFGDRIIGMDDPGMVAIVRMLECIRATSS